MPYTRRPYVRRRKPQRRVPRRYPRRRRATGYRKYPTTAVVKGISPFPDRMFVKLRWTFFADQSTTSPASYDYLSYRGNSPYDPYYTGVTGGQPMGYDQYAAIYDRVLCRASKITVCFTPDSSQDVDCAIVASDATTPNTTWSNIYSRANSVKGVMLPIGSAQKCKMLTMYRTVRKIFGLKKLDEAEDSYIALTSGNPGNQFFYHVFIGPVDRTSYPSLNVHTRVTITYYCLFFQKNLLVDT